MFNLIKIFKKIVCPKSNIYQRTDKSIGQKYQIVTGL